MNGDIDKCHQLLLYSRSDDRHDARPRIHAIARRSHGERTDPATDQRGTAARTRVGAVDVAPHRVANHGLLRPSLAGTEVEKVDVRLTTADASSASGCGAKASPEAERAPGREQPTVHLLPARQRFRPVLTAHPPQADGLAVAPHRAARVLRRLPPGAALPLPHRRGRRPRGLGLALHGEGIRPRAGSSSRRLRRRTPRRRPAVAARRRAPRRTGRCSPR